MNIDIFSLCLVLISSYLILSHLISSYLSLTSRSQCAACESADGGVSRIAQRYRSSLAALLAYPFEVQRINHDF
jgi:hypothetical protein